MNVQNLFAWLPWKPWDLVLTDSMVARDSSVHRRNLGQRSTTKGLAFAYTDDSGDFSKAVRRCAGVGACRTPSGGGMCPSFRATQDELYSTRGRSRLLSEMLNGSLQDEGWQSTDVKDALDLCLSCLCPP